MHITHRLSFRGKHTSKARGKHKKRQDETKTKKNSQSDQVKNGPCTPFLFTVHRKKDVCMIEAHEP